MKTKLKSILAAALCAVGLAAFAAPDAVQLWADGPYFATCNVGATAPQEYGILTNFDDAAQAVTDALGDGWRVPTMEDFTNLLNNCNHSWSNNYNNTGINGRVFTSKSDSSNSIFLPAAGCDYGDGRVMDGNAGLYWSSILEVANPNCAWSLCSLESIARVGSDTRSNGFSVRAVRDTPPPPKQEISAVSAEGFLDLTVGDRVAEAEEPIVADPAWGNAKTATVKIDGESPAREYLELSIDTWYTSMLTPGRYGMKFTSGATNETAAFWKLGAGWEVLDNSQYNEGIEFQAGTTYLVLKAATVPDNKKLTVLDGAKFEYGTGAGFIGGQLEAPRRYRKEVVEGGPLYRIVEAIKGCEDNPWEIGEGVEAYTNGTDNLVIVGKGTITDLSEIPPAVKTGIAAITVADATVKNAAAGVFFGFDKVTVTLQENWQGELPDEKNTWCGATNVKLTRVPTAVKSVKVQQRYPWNGKVDVDFDLTGEGDVKVTVQVTVDGKKLKNPTVDGETTFELGKGKELKDCRLTWDAKADFGDAEKHEKIKVKLTVEKGEAD